MMKNRFGLFSLLLMAASVCMVRAQDVKQFEGRWWICFLEEVGLPLNLTFQTDDDIPVLYSPMQSDVPLKASKWSLRNDTLRFNDKQSGVKLTLKWSVEEETFAGVFRQGLHSEDIVFKPSEGMYKPRRPQTPESPFPYDEEEVVVNRKRQGVTLTGTLTLPKGEGPYAAVVLVSGSGQQNRDEELMGHKPFLVLSDYLTRHGIAALRYDDRGVGGSKGEVEKATTLDFADDAEAVFEYLRKHKKIDAKKVGIIGHSEGAAIASIVASKNKKVAFIVMLAGQGCSGEEILLQQNEKIMLLNGVPQELTDRHVEVLKEFFAVCDTLQESEYQTVMKSLCKKYSEGLDKEERKQAALRDIDAITMAQQFAIPWMKTFVKFDNSIYLRKVHCPLLALNGTKDCQVVVENLEMIRKVTNGRAETVAMEGLNHLFQHCDTGRPAEYMLIEETFASEAMEKVAVWI